MKNHWINKKEKDALALFARVLSNFSHYGEGTHYLRKMNYGITEEEAEDIIQMAKEINGQNQTNTHQPTQNSQQ